MQQAVGLTIAKIERLGNTKIEITFTNGATMDFLASRQYFDWVSLDEHFYEAES